MRTFGILWTILGTLCAFFVLSAPIPVVNKTYANGDILETIFEPAKDHDQIIDLWNNPDAVWSEFFVWKDNLIARVIQRLLEVMVALGIVMVVVVGIQYMLSQSDEAKQKKLLWYLLNIALWIIIALSVRLILGLVLSITQSSITI